MNIKSTYIKLYRFLTTDIWSIRHDEVSPIRFFMYTVLKKLMLAVEFTTTKRITSSAAALTYSTLLAIVPILAVVFAIARGFGYNKYIETWFRESLSSQPQAAETIIGFVNSYLVHTKSGLFLGIGLVRPLLVCTRYRSCLHALHRDNAGKQHRADIQLYLAGKEASKRLPNHNRLHINVPPCAIGYSHNFRYKHLLRHYIPADRRHHVVGTYHAILPTTNAIRYNVRSVCGIVCVHAQH